MKGDGVVENERLALAQEMVSLPLEMTAMTELGLHKGWITIPEENRSRLLEECKRFDQELRALKERVLAKLLVEKADPREVHIFYAQELQKLVDEVTIKSAALGVRYEGRAIAEGLEEMAESLSCGCESVGQELSLPPEKWQRIVQQAKEHLKQVAQRARALAEHNA